MSASTEHHPHAEADARAVADLAAAAREIAARDGVSPAVAHWLREGAERLEASPSRPS